MQNKFVVIAYVVYIGVLSPLAGHCQTNTGDSLMTATAINQVQGLQGSLNTVFTTMLGYCGVLIGVGSGLAALGALLFISYRVWGHLARAEQIDFFPLLRPFAIGITLTYFTGFITMLNAVLQPTVDATSALVKNSNQAISTLLQQKQTLIQQGAEWQAYVGPDGNGNMQKWEQYTGVTNDNGISSGFGMLNWAKFEMAKAEYNIKNSFKVVLSQFLEILFEGAALCVNTIRIFYLVVLAIVGPLVFGLSAFDGFTHLFTAWLAKYVHIFLWLPITNIFGSIIGQVQVQMLNIDISQLKASGQTIFGPTDAAYLVFLCMGIVGYFTVPSITQHVVTVFPVGGSHLAKMTNLPNQTTKTMTDAVETTVSAVGAASGMIL